jgi:hypothetical protein
MIILRPFWRYYGGKWRAAPRYPAPLHNTIIEPFAGAAGYSMRYSDRQVILVEKYPVIAAIWRWLIKVTPFDVLAIPECDDVDALPSWVPQEARWLVGFTMNSATATPRVTLSAGCRSLNRSGRSYGWTAAHRERVARQVPLIRHWRVIEGDYTRAPDIAATWFIDSPYAGRPGSHYVHGSSRIDYRALGRWCRNRGGQVMVCEAAGADWLPFAPFGVTHGVGAAQSHEALWTRERS